MQENKRVADEFSELTGQIERDINSAKNTPPTRGESFSQLVQEFLPTVPAGSAGERVVMLATAGFIELLLELGSSFGPLFLAQARAPRAPRPQPKPVETERTIQAIQAAVGTSQAAPALPAPPDAPPEPVDPPEEPKLATSNVVDLSGRPLAVGHSASLDDALLVLFEPAPGQRLLLADVVASVNRNLPRHKRLTSPRKISELLMPALESTSWDLEKVKTGGRIYIIGLRPRHVARTRRKS